MALRGDADSFLDHPHYRRTVDGIAADPARLAASRRRLLLVQRLLAAIAARPPQLGCLGLHEWAMAHGQSADEVRHATYALRVAPREVERVIDAYRFFTPTSTPLNAHRPTRADQHA